MERQKVKYWGQYEVGALHPAVAQWLFDSDIAFDHEVNLKRIRRRADFCAITNSGLFLFIEVKSKLLHASIRNGAAQLIMYAKYYRHCDHLALMIPRIERWATDYARKYGVTLYEIPQLYIEAAEYKELVDPYNYALTSPATTTQVKHPDFYPFVPIIGRRSE